jgi:hypothetical protein
VALKTLQAWEALLGGQGEDTRPFIHGLLPAIVSVSLFVVVVVVRLIACLDVVLLVAGPSP